MSEVRSGQSLRKPQLPSTATWELAPHTRAKHELLRRYLGAWYGVFASSRIHGRLIYLDGFAGPGAYSGGEPGSPLIALDALINHSSFSNWHGIKFVFLFIEKDREFFNSLNAELARFWTEAGGTPPNVSVHTYNSEFASLAQHIVYRTRGVLAPTLAFIDPFGWSGVPMTTIRDLLSSDKCEVIFNFMHDSINRFVGIGGSRTSRSFTDLFAADNKEHLRISELKGSQRKSGLRALFERQLQQVGGFRFVRSFEVMDLDRGRTAYFLTFGTRNHRGLEKMKDAMWKLDPIGGTRFTGTHEDELTLFPPQPDLSPLRETLMRRFAGASVRVDQVRAFALEETIYKVSHCNQALRRLEEEQLLACQSDRRRGTFPTGTILQFISNSG